jgi:hypothetical protein
MMGRNAFSCSKFFEKPMCGKCRGGHKMENCGLKCSYCFELSHTDERCWKKNKRGLPTTANYLKVLVNDEEATLTELNRLCEMKKWCFQKQEYQVVEILLFILKLIEMKKSQLRMV